MDEPPRFRQSSRKFARVQRQNMTSAETMLWRAVRGAVGGSRAADTIGRPSGSVAFRNRLAPYKPRSASETARPEAENGGIE